MIREKEEELYENIVNNAETVIGSRPWGGATPDSDIDLIYTVEKAEKLLNYFNEKHINVSTLAGSSENEDDNTMFNIHNIKVTIDGQIINILSYKPEDIPKLNELNEIMESLKKFPFYKIIENDKRYRVSVVQALFSTLFEEHKYENVINIDLDEMPFLI